MALESLLERIAVALEGNTAILEKLEAGREAALAQLEAKADKSATRSRKKTEEPAAPETKAPATPTAPTVSDDDLRAAATDYIKGAGDDADAKKARAANIKAITDHFGTKTLVGETGVQDADARVQTMFYLKRFAAGLEVNFSAEYDFSGDPTQGGDSGADELDAIG